MFCPICGKDGPLTAGRCATCGVPVSDPADLNVATLLTPAATIVAGVVDADAGTVVAPSAWPEIAPALEQGIGTDAALRTAASTVAAGAVEVPRIPIGGPPVVHAAANGGPLEVGESFGPRYHIIRLLGAGGMGAVYQAWDVVLEIAVAIKVIRPEAVVDPIAAVEVERRFKRELLLARRVTHKNVVRIHDIGEIRGIKYITMSYVEGIDLATRLKQEGPQSVAATLRTARAALAGLVAAHTAGVVHRDLKPANIMVSAEDDALIMDFGVARSMEATDSPAATDPALAAFGRDAFGSTAHTMDGAIVGTIRYMAPEQAHGAPVDGRADIYSFGLILYDMLAGRQRASGAKSASAELQARMERPPPSIRSIVPAVSEALDRIVTRCLEPDPEKRYQTSSDLAADLERLDENGEPIPEKRVVGMRAVAAIVVLALALLGGSWWYASTLAPPVAHEPVSLLIADLQNRTGDVTLDGTLEPILKRGLEGAGFISAYDRGSLRGTFGVRPPETLDESAARELAAKHGIGIVLSGGVDRQGDGYGISVKAAQTITGDVIADATTTASSGAEIVEAAANLVATVRNALGDDTSDSAQMFAMASLSATSLDVLHHYAEAREASSNGDLERAREGYRQALQLDPKFGIGYQALAGLSMNQGNLQEAETHIKEALRYLDGMTERERFTTRGMYYTLSGDYQQCAKEYADLIARYPAEVLARNNLALCLTYLREVPKALAEMRQVVAMLPARALFRINLALYGSYAGDFQTAEQEAHEVLELGSEQWGLFTLALAQSGQGELARATETYEALSKTNALGASQAASGLGDLAILTGRFSDAVGILEEGAAADVESKNADRAAAKFAALAHARLAMQQRPAAIAAAQQALALSQSVKIRFLAGRIFIHAGDLGQAAPLIEDLASEIHAEPRAYAKILEGQSASVGGAAREAIERLNEANALLDTWMGHFELGRAYLEAKQFLQADSEFDRCLQRRGEAIALFLDEEPTYSHFAAVYYFQGRVREELGTAAFADSYRAYLTLRGGERTEDPLVPEIRRRIDSQ